MAEEALETCIIFGRAAKERLLTGMEIAANAITSTLGPGGKLVLIQKPNNAIPIITKDGITVSKNINLPDPIERLGGQLICEASNRTNEVAGDGTTTTALLTYFLASEGIRLISAGYSPHKLNAGIQKASKRLIKALEKIKKNISTKEELAQIATISANGDTKIGDLISDAITRVGPLGYVSVDSAKGMDTSLEVVEGMSIERGYMSPYFITNNEKMCAFLESPLVLIVDKKIESFNEIIKPLEYVHNKHRSLLIIANDYDGGSLEALILNKNQSNLKVCAIKSPGFGDTKDALLNDISILTGAAVISPKTGKLLDKISEDDFGSCKKITCDKNSTIFVGSGKTENKLNQYIAELQEQFINNISLNQNEIEFLRHRIAKLSSGIAIIRVGGTTEVEMLEKKDRVEDALSSARAAAEEGILPGGGISYLKAGMLCDFKMEDPEEQFGADIIKRCCSISFKKIVDNCGKKSEVILEKVRQEYDNAFSNNKNLENSNLPDIVNNLPSFGYNLKDNTCCDMLACGIIDPFKVARTALENAVSVCSVVISLDCILYDEKR